MSFYENKGYHFERLPNKLINIVLDTSVKEKTYNLIEPLVIDKHSDIFIDSFITFHTHSTEGEETGYKTSSSNAVFIMGIKDLNMQGVSNGSDSTYYNKIVIPNTYGTQDNDNDKVTVHKSNKFNFVSSINPTTLSSLTISLTNNNKDEIGVTGSKAWLVLYVVARD